MQKNLTRDFAAGLVTSSVSLAYCFSFGALIFAGPLQRFLGQGVAAALICSAVTGLVISLKSGFPMSISGPEGNTAALMAAMMASLAPALAAQTDDGALYLALAALAAAGLATGIALYLLGCNRLGRLARFIPYPVVAGFQAASGWVMAAGAIRMSTGVPVKLSTIAAFSGTEAAAMLAVTAAWAWLLWQITVRIKHFLALPVALAIAAFAADLTFKMLESSGRPMHAANWMFTATKGMDVALPMLARGFWHAHWAALLPVSGEIAAAILMAALTIVFTATAIEQAWRTDVDLDDELRVQGLANIASGLAGGLIGHISLNRTILAREAGGTGRITGVVVALVGLAVLSEGLSLVGYVPRFVLAGLLLELGVRLMWRWSVASRGRLTTLEWLLVPAILLVTAWFGVLIGFLVGVLGGCVIFALSVSRVDIVRHGFTLDERPSSLVRSSEEMELIAAHGSEVHILQLASFIFFGSAYHLQERIRTLLSQKSPRMVIFDFSAVSGIDSSAGSSLLRIEEMLRNHGVTHVVVGVSGEIRHVMTDTGALCGGVIGHDSLDVALELGENTLLGVHGLQPADYRPLNDWLADALGGEERAAVLIAALEPAHYADGGHLCRAGDPTDSLLFIERGRVSVEVERPGHTPIRQRVFGANTLLGEIGFFLDVPRTADLRIDGVATVWALGRAAYERLNRDNPDLTAALLTYTVRIQAERLAFSSRQVAALQR
ncbi:MAG: putative sulfate transporter conatining a cAMP-binding domain-like [Rhodospirillales bacterium]|nr:putative sulfate transporter conatining a cAMP-binding domain-like [Rhodospirillales bacterium]